MAGQKQKMCYFARAKLGHSENPNCRIILKSCVAKWRYCGRKATAHSNNGDVMSMVRSIKRKFAGAIGLFGGLGLLVIQPAVAESFPDGKPIEMTVMFGAGSAADVTARHLADGMSKALKVPVPVVNRTGGGGAR